MLSWGVGEVQDILGEEQSLQEVEVLLEGVRHRAWHFPQWMGRVQPGDVVLLNTTAVELGLGTGGYHIVTAILEREGRPYPYPQGGGGHGHIMKLRYTPYQFAVRSVEEQNSPHHQLLQEADSIEGMPVFVGELHSMLPILFCALRHFEATRNWRMAYIMSDSAALPLPLSHHVRHLQHLGGLAGTITYGQAFGGEWEAVNIYSALLAARHVCKADVAVVTMGPGIVGTGTRWGFSGTDMAEVVHAAHALEGRPVLIPRISFADRRLRHQGLSHHLLTLLQKAVYVPVVMNVPPFSGWQESVIQAQLRTLTSSPAQIFRQSCLEQEELGTVLSHYPYPIQTMGRTAQEDSAFFLAVVQAVAPLLG